MPGLALHALAGAQRCKRDAHIPTICNAATLFKHGVLPQFRLVHLRNPVQNHLQIDRNLLAAGKGCSPAAILILVSSLAWFSSPLSQCRILLLWLSGLAGEFTVRRELRMMTEEWSKTVRSRYSYPRAPSPFIFRSVLSQSVVARGWPGWVGDRTPLSWVPMAPHLHVGIKFRGVCCVKDGIRFLGSGPGRDAPFRDERWPSQSDVSPGPRNSADVSDPASPLL